MYVSGVGTVCLSACLLPVCWDGPRVALPVAPQRGLGVFLLDREWVRIASVAWLLSAGVCCWRSLSVVTSAFAVYARQVCGPPKPSLRCVCARYGRVMSADRFQCPRCGTACSPSSCGNAGGPGLGCTAGPAAARQIYRQRRRGSPARPAAPHRALPVVGYSLPGESTLLSQHPRRLLPRTCYRNE